MERLTVAVLKHRWIVLAAWIVSIGFGMAVGAPRAADRLSDQFVAKGFESTDAGLRQLKHLGTGAQPPFVLVFRTHSGDVTRMPQLERAIEQVAAANEGSRVSSWFTTHEDGYVSAGHSTMYADVYPPGPVSFSNGLPQLQATQKALAAATPEGITSRLTGINVMYFADPEANDTGVLADVIVGAVGALVILLFVFGTLPAVAMPLVIAMASILTTFSLVLGLTYATDVSIVVQFLIGLVGLGIAIDYSLLVIFRYREELARGVAPREALLITMRRAGRSVIVSGTTVAISLVSMIALPLDFLRSIGYGGLLIPLVSVVAALTLLPVLLSFLGHRINSIPLLPRHITSPMEGTGFWPRWSRFVTSRPVPIALLGIVVTGVLLVPGAQMHAADPEARAMPGTGPVFEGRDMILGSKLPEGAFKPFNIVIEGRGHARVAERVADRLRRVDGIAFAVAPGAGWSDGSMSVVEAVSKMDGTSRAGARLMDQIAERELPRLERSIGGGTDITMAGIAPESRDFIDAIYGNIWLLFLCVAGLTYLLLARATRSLVLPLKAVVLNVASLVAAYGVIVFVFQFGHGAEAIWDVPTTESITTWVPLMIFAFLFGISMDYEVFMLARIREEYDVARDTATAIGRGLERTGKLITSGSLILMFAFFVLSTGPGIDLKQFSVGLAAGIVVDATIIRVLLVPSVMMALGRYNWWFPDWASRLLMVPPTDEHGLHRHGDGGSQSTPTSPEPEPASVR